MNVALVSLPPLRYRTAITLEHDAEVMIIGVSENLTIYVEEIYGDDGWMAQAAYTLDGTKLNGIDEQFGQVMLSAPLPLPEDLVKPHRGWHTMELNFTGPRHRGLRGPERLADLVQPITIQDKMALVDMLKLNIPAPMLLGLAESYVLAEAQLIAPNLFVVCRRLRLAIALPEERIDDEGLPYDYDTMVIYAAHFVDLAAEHMPSLPDSLTTFADGKLSRPMDCLYTQGRLWIADGGAAGVNSRVHVWDIDITPPDNDPKTDLQHKLYG